MQKKIIINLLSNYLHYNLIIYSIDGKILKNSIINRNNVNICIYTKECYIKIVSSYNKQVNYKTIYLNNNKCQNICLSYVFNNIFQIVSNRITLSDKKYGFPIKKAILKFKENSPI